ncbi:hypothetical protein BBK82_41255 [Lentzea guizhouensis]|uniref:Uncharacterized protein n=1 Tax=Lentzea guizhouensis TaxID=1586287 RepID=A0A1B2HUR0_9PSEU|nr:hypothetical protein [Lentzea guizhouensis]ANZ41437.1 hypothetical protein BBK82_41255 [Lentzea guizhouensis]
MRNGTARLLAAGLVALATVPAGCSRGGNGGGSEIRVVPAHSLVLERAPRPTDRELVLRIAFTRLSSGLEPVERIEVQQRTDEIGIRVSVRERIPGSDEVVPNDAFTRTETIQLDQPIGTATVVDLNQDPSRPIKPLGGG